MNATNLFREAVAAIPKDVTTQVNWSFAIADKMDAKLKEIGMTQKEFAKEVGKTEPEVSRWLSADIRRPHAEKTASPGTMTSNEAVHLKPLGPTHFSRSSQPIDSAINFSN